jgi:hypothetical protein
MACDWSNMKRERAYPGSISRISSRELSRGKTSLGSLLPAWLGLPFPRIQRNQRSSPPCTLNGGMLGHLTGIRRTSTSWFRLKRAVA